MNPSVFVGPGSHRWESALHWLRHIPAVPMLATLNSFVDVRDAARAALLAMSVPRSGERYIVTAHNVDMLSFTRLALRATGSRAPVFPAPRSLIRAADAAMAGLAWLRLNPGIKPISELNVDKAYSSQKIRRELGWAPMYSLEQSLRDTLAPLPGQMEALRWPVAGQRACQARMDS